MIYRVVDAEEAVVGVLERIDGDGAVLSIVATTFLVLNYRKFCDSCHALQFFFQGVIDVFSDGFFGNKSIVNLSLMDRFVPRDDAKRRGGKALKGRPYHTPICNVGFL